MKIAIGGWGGGVQLPAILQGLDKALPRDIVFTCLNPNQGWAPQPDFMARIAKNRPVWAIPWLEGDRQLWHLQPRVGLLRDHVKLAHDQNLERRGRHPLAHPRDEAESGYFLSLCRRAGIGRDRERPLSGGLHQAVR